MGRRNGEKGKRRRILKQPTEENIEFNRQLDYFDDTYCDCGEVTDEMVKNFYAEPDSRAKQHVIEHYPKFAVNPEN